ncbi:MAG: hypothetical protein A3F83_01345 [Candidatus Glassbacteria bacterium RIFCSPLOWO2_12_FULL_58_11]|uniref:Uncharacterized protein n=1 Tax=Candidatus Glassbacteria bacterium RIFCSPLOWO2_12_FULL_58_11 TaxID=1817867 RepID=A0A1F5YL07_9BACT|nr:MAG: hypothetical protein A3F83_01345 [Candidatus Glassbacteria bacterium RIFCSPLOWO2_12_FULL_58_11]
MLKAGRELLPSILKLERLLGHGLAITDEILVERVNAAIQRQLATFNVQILPIDTNRVDWPRLIEDAAGRQPPFEAGKDEKGFRDALIAETFVQLVGNSPKSPTTCRIVLVTSDGLLATTVEMRTSMAANVRILRSLDELRILINTVVGDVTEEFVKSIQEIAKGCFFIKDNQNSLYYKAKVADQIISRFDSELKTRPVGSEVRKNGTWLLSAPRFINKKGQRIHWVSTILVEARATRNETYNSSLADAILGNLFSNKPPKASLTSKSPFGFYSSIPDDLSVQVSPLSGFITGDKAFEPKHETRELVVAEGQSVFEVHWSVTVTKSGKLVRPSIDDILFKETTWAGGPDT